jgi:hypothetical protein
LFEKALYLSKHSFECGSHQVLNASLGVLADKQVQFSLALKSRIELSDCPETLFFTLLRKPSLITIWDKAGIIKQGDLAGGYIA